MCFSADLCQPANFKHEHIYAHNRNAGIGRKLALAFLAHFGALPGPRPQPRPQLPLMHERPKMASKAVRVKMDQPTGHVKNEGTYASSMEDDWFRHVKTEGGEEMCTFEKAPAVSGSETLLPDSTLRPGLHHTKTSTFDDLVNSIVCSTMKTVQQANTFTSMQGAGKLCMCEIPLMPPLSDLDTEVGWCPWACPCDRSADIGAAEDDAWVGTVTSLL